MDSTGSSSIKKQDDSDPQDSKNAPKLDVKPIVRTLNRVPRACNACRKQKMRCEGAENPPCKRCRHAGLECLFEKPTREASLTGEAGLERIRSLEAHVADIRQTQTAIQNTLLEIATHLRGGAPLHSRSPSTYPPFPHHSPSNNSLGSPGVSTPSTGHMASQHMVDTPQTSQQGTSNGGSISSPHGVHRQHRDSIAGHSLSGSHSTTLPPFSTLETMGPPRGQHANVSSMRFNAGDQGRLSVNGPESGSGSKRGLPASNAASADTSDAEDDNGELPASGLVAPWEVLRGLADVAIERAAKENGGGEESEPQSRARSGSPNPKQLRPSKRRKVHHRIPQHAGFPDVVTKNLLTEDEARELFRIFYHGCSTFLPVFDGNVDTYDNLHERSPFAVDCICMVAARVRDGGGKSSETTLKCQEEVQAISCATLFSPVSRQEAVQAMILVSGWSDNGWLSGGHAVRMALELSMHKAWPELFARMKAGKASTSDKDRYLVVSARTWLCLYIFEHQMSYGTGRPAILKDDDGIAHCRALLQHPLAIEDDMRLVSMVELMAIRERAHNNLSPLFDRPVDENTINVLHEADIEFRNWYSTWDQAFSQKYEDAAFYRQSLQIQHLHAELFHNATALRGIDGPEDVQKMPATQRELAIRSIQIGRQALDITINSPAYREGMKYAVHYTHATATFSASFLLRLSRLFPDQCDFQEIRMSVERLAALLSEVPGKRYALTLQLMLNRFKKRKSFSRSPKVPRQNRHRSQSQSEAAGYASDVSQSVTSQQAISPTYEVTFPHYVDQMNSHAAMGAPQIAQYANVDQIWRGFETTSTEQLPVWLSDQTLGGASFSQNGIDAFLLPPEYLPPAPQIW